MEFKCLHCGRGLTREWVNSPIKQVPAEWELCSKNPRAWAIHFPVKAK